jgi:hypothetical protein
MKAIRFLIAALLEAPSLVKREIAAILGDTLAFGLRTRFMAARDEAHANQDEPAFLWGAGLRWMQDLNRGAAVASSATPISKSKRLILSRVPK